LPGSLRTHLQLLTLERLALLEELKSLLLDERLELRGSALSGGGRGVR
jgi:hypothetical protein